MLILLRVEVNNLVVSLVKKDSKLSDVKVSLGKLVREGSDSLFLLFSSGLEPFNLSLVFLL